MLPLETILPYLTRQLHLKIQQKSFKKEEIGGEYKINHFVLTKSQDSL